MRCVDDPADNGEVCGPRTCVVKNIEDLTGDGEVRRAFQRLWR